MLPTESVKVGDVVVVEPAHERGNSVRAMITKAPRVWLEMQEIDPEGRAREWRMRRDTQDSGDSNYTNRNSRFYTLEQYAARQLAQVMSDILKDHGIEVTYKSPHRHDQEFKNDLANWLQAREARMAAISKIQAELA